jgi:formate-dependent nitrite reductase membrane component NrfD
MLIAIALIVIGLAATAAGFPLAQRSTGWRGILAACAVLAGIIALLIGVVLLIVPKFFVT